MDGITLSFTDARPVLAPGALEEQVRAAAPLLAEAAAGEERYRDNLGWHSVDEAAGPERVDFLLEQAARVRADADAFVVIGIGGSNQASRAAVKALRPEGGPAILWAGNTISACEMARTLRELDGYQSIYIDCIAKNFETLEPGIAFRVLRQYLERRYGAEGAAKRIFATGTPGSTLHQLCLDQGYTFLTFPETIGGRYSVGSDVGLFPMAVAGVDKSRVVIAYEPIWSIGPGKTPADKPYIEKIARFVKEQTGGLDVVYGGGLKADNAAMLASIADIDGGLIALTRFSGEIGFYPDEYLEIIRLYLGH